MEVTGIKSRNFGRRLPFESCAALVAASKTRRRSEKDLTGAEKPHSSNFLSRVLLSRANNLKFLIACLVLCFAITPGAYAQAPKRIQFAKGHSSATIAGVTGHYGAAYLVRGRSRQKLVLTLNPRARVGIKVEGIGRYGRMVLLRERRGGTYEVGLEESGDYMIVVGSTDNRSIPFSLTVRINRMTDI